MLECHIHMLLKIEKTVSRILASILILASLIVEIKYQHSHIVLYGIHTKLKNKHDFHKDFTRAYSLYVREAFIQIEWCGFGGPGSAPGVGLNLLYM